MPVNIWITLLILSVSLARFSMGVYTSISGPTLLYLADNVGENVYKISMLFSGRSIGALIGSVIAGTVNKALGPNFRHLLSLGAGIGILAVTDVAVPWLNKFWILLVSVTIGGLMFGYLDAGLQAVLLRLWGEKASRVHIQIYHLMYSVGAFVAPLIASPFLVKSHQESSTKNICPNSDVITTTQSSINISTTAAPPEEFNPTGWVYLIASALMVSASILLMILAACNVEGKVKNLVEEDGHISEDREEGSLKDLVYFFLLVIGYYFCCVATENVYYNYIYSISICSDLQFTVRQASEITSIFWLGFGLGRLTGVLSAKYVSPQRIIILSIGGSVVDTVFMKLFGEHTTWLAWLATASHGYTTAMLYPSGVSWVSKITNISGKYMFICNVGNGLGSLTMLFLAGYLFQNVNPFSVMDLILGLSVANAGFYSLLHIVGNRRLKLTREKERNEEDRLCAFLSDDDVSANVRLIPTVS